MSKTISGNNIYIEDALKAPLINFELEGKTTQATRSGKNLLNVPQTFSVTGYVNIKSLFPSLEVGQEYIVSWGEITKGGDGNPALVLGGGTSWQLMTPNRSYTFTFTSEPSAIYVYSNGYNASGSAGITSIIKDFMIRKSSVTDGTYEEYGVMPSPDYPSNIVSVGTYNNETGKYELKVKTTGKNIFNPSDFVSKSSSSLNTSLIENGINVKRGNTTSYEYPIKCKENTQYTIKFNFTNPTNNYYISFKYSDNTTTTIVGSTTYGSSTLITKTSTANKTITAIKFETYGWANNMDLTYIQLEQGTQGTEYEQYKENVYIYTLNEPIRAIDNAKDKLYIENGMLYVERKIGKTIFNGSENWQTWWNITGYCRPYLQNFNQMKSQSGNTKTTYYSNMDWHTRSSTNNGSTNFEFINTNSNTFYVGILKSRIGGNDSTSASDLLALFKTWLSTHNTEVNYELATPVIEELGEVDIPSTHKGITYIDTTDELEPNMSIEYVNDFSEADKQALQNNTAAIKCKLIVQATDQLPEIELTENNAVKDWTYTDERLVPGKGFIGQFVGRTLDGNLQNISDTFNILNREIKFMFGVYRMNDETETWYDFGNFIVTKPENNEVNDNTKFETMDYTKLFNKSFDGDYTDDEYPNSFNALTDPNNENRQTVSARWLAKYTCKQVGVDLATTNFINNNFQIDGNPFKAGETCRDVMKAIAQLAFSWVRIGWDNRCYIDFEQGDPNYITTYETIDNDQYFSLKTLETVTPVDGVGFGMKNIDGETAFKLATGKTMDTAENIIYLYDNPLLYTFDLRTLAVASADVLFGLTFNQLETETIGHPWLIGSSYINMIDMENNNHYTYAFNNSMKYKGHIRSTISSIYETEVEQTLGYESDLVRNITDAWIEVNKINGELSAQSKRITDVEDGMSGYYTIDEVDDLLVNYEQGITNIFSRTGGNNKFRNSGLWFEEGSGFEYWTGNVKVTTNMQAGSQTSMILQNGTIEQVITGIPNGRYTISFNCKKLINGATLTVDIDLVSITLGDVDEFEQVIDVTTNTIDFKLTCDVTDGYEIYDLMCNMGDEKTIWSQHQNETRTDTVNISKGITITSTASNATFKANADGIRIENKVNSRVTNFLDDGMETYNAKISGQAEVSGALFTKVGNQTWINGL